MSAHEIWGLTKQAFSEFSEDKASRLGASLAYYTVFSLAPMLVLAVVIAGWVLRDSAQAESQVVDTMSRLVSGMDKEQAREMIANAKQHGSGILATVISIVILLYGATNVFAELQDSMNTIWEVKPKPDQGWWAMIRQRILSLAMVFGIIFLLLVSLVVSTVMTAVVGWVIGEGEGIFYKTVGIILDIVVSIPVLTLLFAMMFKYLPDVKIQWKFVWIGAAVTAVLFTIGRYALSLYFTYGSATSVFGAAGSLAALLIWVYYSAQILFFGAEFTQVYARKYGAGLQPTEYAEPVRDEDRAQLGLSPPKAAARMAAPAEARWGTAHAPRRQPARVASWSSSSSSSTSRKPYAAAGGGLAAGILVGAIGAIKRANARQRITSKEAAVVDLDQRLDRIEHRLARMKQAVRASDELHQPPSAPREIWEEFREGFEEGHHPHRPNILERLGLK